MASTQTPLVASSLNVANAAAVATLTPSGGRTAYIEGFEVRGYGATGATMANVTVTGLAGGSLTYLQPVPAGVTTTITPLLITFPSALGGNPPTQGGSGGSIVVTLSAFGTGNTNACVNIYGYQK